MKSYDKCHTEIRFLGPEYSFDLPVLHKRKRDLCVWHGQSSVSPPRIPFESTVIHTPFVLEACPGLVLSPSVDHLPPSLAFSLEKQSNICLSPLTALSPVLPRSPGRPAVIQQANPSISPQRPPGDLLRALCHPGLPQTRSFFPSPAILLSDRALPPAL